MPSAHHDGIPLAGRPAQTVCMKSSLVLIGPSGLSDSDQVWGDRGPLNVLSMTSGAVQVELLPAVVDLLRDRVPGGLVVLVAQLLGCSAWRHSRLRHKIRVAPGNIRQVRCRDGRTHARSAILSGREGCLEWPGWSPANGWRPECHPQLRRPIREARRDGEHGNRVLFQNRLDLRLSFGRAPSAGYPAAPCRGAGPPSRC